MSKIYTTPLTPELGCTNIETSLAFYVGVLGFTIQYQRPEEGFAMLVRQGSRLMLDQLYGIDGTGRSWLAGPLERPYGRGINLQMQTENVDALYARVCTFYVVKHTASMSLCRSAPGISTFSGLLRDIEKFGNAQSTRRTVAMASLKVGSSL